MRGQLFRPQHLNIRGAIKQKVLSAVCSFTRNTRVVCGSSRYQPRARRRKADYGCRALSRGKMS